MTTPPRTPVIRIDGANKTFALPKGEQFHAVKSVTLDVYPGDIFGLIGKSGAGKSTLLRLINLLERPDGGQVVVDGQTLTALPAAGLRRARQNIGMIFQQFNLMANRTVADNVAFPLEIAGWPAAERAARVAECLALVGLADRAGDYPAQLSGGQKQRVGIARALAPRPHVLLADEPTSALDPATTRGILDCLADINQRLGVTVVIVTHEMAVVRAICHRAAVVTQGTIAEIFPVIDGVAQANSAAGLALLEEA